MVDTFTKKTLVLGFGVLAVALLGSAIKPYDRITWLLEVFPVLIAVPVIWTTRSNFALTKILYAIIFIHCFILIFGGLYTYARVPLGFWMRDIFHLDRNPYDKIGHFFQGVTPALLSREIFVRKGYMKRNGMLVFVICSISLAVSALYELIEWWSALALGQGADEFLGTQGDIWDTQSDMMFALIGGICCATFLSRVHNRQLRIA